MSKFINLMYQQNIEKSKSLRNIADTTSSGGGESNDKDKKTEHIGEERKTTSLDKDTKENTQEETKTSSVGSQGSNTVDKPNANRKNVWKAIKDHFGEDTKDFAKVISGEKNDVLSKKLTDKVKSFKSKVLSEKLGLNKEDLATEGATTEAEGVESALGEEALLALFV